MLVTEIYNTLKQAQLVSTLEEYSTQWLNKHKTTASYLIHKKRDLSIRNKVNCLNSIIERLQDLKKSEFFSEFNSKKIQNLEFIKQILILDLFKNKIF
jgi:hypothetical protein